MCYQLVTLNGVHPNRTHQRLQQPPNGFEDRPEHQSRLPSAIHCSGTATRTTLRQRGADGYTGKAIPSTSHSPVV